MIFKYFELKIQFEIQEMLATGLAKAKLIRVEPISPLKMGWMKLRLTGSYWLR